MPGWVQESAELEWDGGSGPASREPEGAESVFLAWDFPDLRPRQCGQLQVRVLGPDGWAAWSQPLTIAVSFLAEDERRVPFIGLAESAQRAKPVLLRTELDVRGGLEPASLHATARGVDRIWLTGTATDDGGAEARVDALPAPVDARSHSRQQPAGPRGNALGPSLAGGWYTETYGFRGMDRTIYGEQPSFAAQLLARVQRWRHRVGYDRTGMAGDRRQPVGLVRRLRR